MLEVLVLWHHIVTKTQCNVSLLSKMLLQASWKIRPRQLLPGASPARCEANKRQRRYLPEPISKTAHPLSMEEVMTGSCCWMARTSCVLSLLDRKSVPMFWQPAYAGLVLKNCISLERAACGCAPM